MKVKLILLIAAGLLFITACNDDTKTLTATKDSAASQSPNMTDSMKVESGLMKSMADMTAKVDNMQMSGDFDVDFASMMIKHHQGAIDMAQIEVSKGTDQKIKLMAQNIITKQTEEQGKLREVIKSYTSEQPKRDTTNAEYQLHNAMINMMDKMTGMQMTGNTDMDFVMMIIPHHESAIEMAKSELSHGKNKQLKQMAQKGITDQTKEINDFKSLMLENK